jgi:hypothetical protein
VRKKAASSAARAGFVKAFLSNDPEFANDPALSATAAAFIVDAWKDSTLRCYASGERLYRKFCKIHLLHPSTYYPPSAGRLKKFATYAATQMAKTHGSISSALTAVRSLCTSIGCDTSAFDDMQLKLLLKGLKKKHKSKVRGKRVGITIWALARFFHLIDRNKSTHRTLFGAMVMAVFGLLRASEFVAKAPYGATLFRRHVTILSDRVIVHLMRSKTDTYDEGVDVILWSNGGPLCPRVWALAVMAEACDRRPGAPFFQTASGSPLSYDALQNFIKYLASAAGFKSDSFSTHSLRIGGATSLIECGFSREVVKQLGRWSSDAYMLYVRISHNVHQDTSAKLAKAAEDRSAPVFCGMSLQEYAGVNSSNIDTFVSSAFRGLNRRARRGR